MSRRYDLVILGGGTGGLVSALIAAGVGARVALIERDRTGGDCLWTGCVPSKSLIAAASLAYRMRHADAVGLAPVEPDIDFAAVMEHVWSTIGTIEPHDSPDRLRAAGVEVIEAPGRFAGPGSLEAAGRELRWRSAIIATGSEPALPPIPGLADADPLTTDTVWNLRELPRRLAILGGGPIGCELAQAFARLGSYVTLVEADERLLTKEEPRASALIAARLRADGVYVHTGTTAAAVHAAVDGGGRELVLEPADRPVIPFDRVVVATGRTPRTQGLGLETIGVELGGRGAIRVDARLRTTNHRVFAVGDVTGLLPFTHVAAHHARIATPNALFKARGKTGATIPWVTFTDPEVGRVGMTEAQARERWGDDITTAETDYSGLDRALTSGEPYGFAKLIADPRGRLVGATVAAPGGGESIAELTAWISRGAKIDDVSQTVHAYPTLAEGPARAADQHLMSRYSTPCLRLVARLALGALRLLDSVR